MIDDAKPRARFAAMLPCMALAVTALLCGPVADAAEAADPIYRVERLVDGFEHPWGMAFLPGQGRMLITERPGRLTLVAYETGTVREVAGVPPVDARGQGGLLDVALHPDFGAEPWVYLTWAGNDDAGLTATYVGRGRLDDEALELADFEVLFVAEPHVDSTAHYGSRIVFDADGRLYVTVGDRQFKNFGPEHHSQDRTTYIGTTLRLEADGSIPPDNPFVDDPDALDGIFSFGHRNSQGMAVHPETGEIWQNEHGEQNGDEVNVIQAGGNYGWPIATYGRRYGTGFKFAPTPPERPDTIQPVFYWDHTHPEGFPPSGFAFYFGDAFPEWRGNALMGNLAHRYLGRFTVDGHDVAFAERLLDGRGWRIRDVAVGPEDGFVYVLIDAADAPLIRLVPADR
ncbi:MAG: PQQ-dependent sugar dehydrogenase [Rhodospirillales bacterium]|nr:MAG: PQQ-dependent sugar dehydrogenase [Rhodospirillales bacterium]